MVKLKKTVVCSFFFYHRVSWQESRDVIMKHLIVLDSRYGIPFKK